METFREEYVLRNFDDEPMVVGRNSQSVSFMKPTLPFPAYHLAPPFMDFKTGSEKIGMYMRTMDPFLVCVSTASKIHIDSMTIENIVKKNLRNFR